MALMVASLMGWVLFSLISSFVIWLRGVSGPRDIFRHVAAYSGSCAFRSFLPPSLGGTAGGFFFLGLVRVGHGSIFDAPF